MVAIGVSSMLSTIGPSLVVRASFVTKLLPKIYFTGSEFNVAKE